MLYIPDLCTYMFLPVVPVLPSHLRRDVTKLVPALQAAGLVLHCWWWRLWCGLTPKPSVTLDDGDCAGARSFTFFLTFELLLGHGMLRPATLFKASRQTSLCTVSVDQPLPFCLASFGYHGNVPEEADEYCGKNRKPSIEMRCTVR